MAHRDRYSTLMPLRSRRVRAGGACSPAASARSCAIAAAFSASVMPPSPEGFSGAAPPSPWLACAELASALALVEFDSMISMSENDIANGRVTSSDDLHDAIKGWK